MNQNLENWPIMPRVLMRIIKMIVFGNVYDACVALLWCEKNLGSRNNKSWGNIWRTGSKIVGNGWSLEITTKEYWLEFDIRENESIYLLSLSEPTDILIR